MKMKLGITWCYLLFMLINHKNSYYASAKSLETQNLAICNEHISEFFKSFLNITIEPSEKVGKCLKLLRLIEKKKNKNKNQWFIH